MRSFLLMAILAFAPVAQAATVTFVNGDRLSGQLLETTADSIKLKTDFGVVSIAYDSIDKIYSNAEAAEQAKGVESTAVTVSNSELSDPVSDPLPGAADDEIMASAAAEPQSKMEDTQELQLIGGTFSGNVNLGASLQNGNSDTRNVNIDSTAKIRWPDHRVSTGVEYNREEDDGQVSVDNKSLDMAYDYFYAPDWFLNSTVDFKKDDISDLSLRSAYGLGIGHQAYEKDDLNLEYVLGAVYLRENYEDESVDSSIAANWKLKYDQTVFDAYLKLFHEHQIFAPSDDWGAYVLESKTGARVPLLKGIVSTLQVDYDRENSPPANVSKNDTIYSLKLGYEW